ECHWIALGRRSLEVGDRHRIPGLGRRLVLAGLGNARSAEAHAAALEQVTRLRSALRDRVLAGRKCDLYLDGIHRHTRSDAKRVKWKAGQPVARVIAIRSRLAGSWIEAANAGPPILPGLQGLESDRVAQLG